MKLRAILGQSAASLLVTSAIYVYTFLCNIALVRMLLPEDFGTVALAVSLVGLVEIFTTFSFNTVLVQQREHPSLIRTIFQAALAVVWLKMVVGLVLYLAMHDGYSTLVWQLFALVLGSKIFSGLGPLLVARLEKRGKFLRATLVTAGSNMVGVSLAVAAVYFGAGIFGLVLRVVAPPVLISLTMAAFYPKLLPSSLGGISRRQMKVVIVSGTRLYFQRGAEMVYMRIPLLLIESFFGAAFLGLFSQATYLVTLMHRFTSVLNQQIAVVFFARNRKNPQDTRSGFLALLSANLVVGLPMAGLLWVIADPLVLWLWGEAWIEAAAILKAMVAMTFLLPVFSLLKSRLLGQRRNNIITLAYLAAIALFCLGLMAVRGVGDPVFWAASLQVGSYGLMIVIFAAVFHYLDRRPSPERTPRTGD